MKETINNRLRELSDSDYKAFNARIVPTAYEVLGVRMPALKALAREIAGGTVAGDSGAAGGSASAIAWLDEGGFSTYEHVILHGLVLAALSRRMPLDEVLTRLDRLIERFDNWAHVDTVLAAFKIFARHKDVVLAHFLPLKTHPGEFCKRTFAVLVTDHFMDDVPGALTHLAEVPQGQYYVDMAVAWAVSVALIKDWDRALPFIKQRRFTRWVHNKAIQKARESFRITADRKESLQKLKIK